MAASPADNPSCGVWAPGNRRIGQVGENLAVEYLRRRGWIILERNWRCSAGEIDVVALDGDELVVCEVKTRASRRAGTALESITPRKLRRLYRLAALWSSQRGGRRLPARVDAIGIHLAADGTFTVEHVRGIS